MALSFLRTFLGIKNQLNKSASNIFIHFIQISRLIINEEVFTLD